MLEGTVFAGRFRVVRAIGRGGMGAVWEVEQLSTGARRALKLMHPVHATDVRMVERFGQEARAASRIPSNHVVEVVDAGVEPETGTPWIAMELLDGEDLATRLARAGAMTPAEALGVLGQIAHGLEHAHRAGIVHRDLKPENVFLADERRSDGARTVKLLDFGIASWAREAGAREASAALGSPLWLAPEQADAGGTISAATDVWAFGLVAFAVLTGRIYWRSASNPATASPHTVMMEVLTAELVPATGRATELGAGDKLPQAFDAWFSSCVVRAMNARFQSVATAFDALRSVFASSPGGPPPPRWDPQPRARDPANAAQASSDRDRPAPPTPARTLALASEPAAVVGGEAASGRRWSRVVAVGCTVVLVAALGLAGAWIVVTGRWRPQRLAERAAASTAQPADCASGSAVGCLELGKARRDGRGVPEDLVGALTAFARGCELGSAEACEEAGRLHERARGMRRDIDRAQSFYERACAAGSTRGCARAGGIILRRHDRGDQAVRALVLNQRACDAGDAIGCVNLGAHNDFGRAIPVDDAAAVVLYRRACDAGELLGCAELAALIGVGEGATQDRVRAISLASRACDGGEPRGCLALASLHRWGAIADRDEARALGLYDRACEGGEIDACALAADLRAYPETIASDVASALPVAERTCADPYQSGCHLLARLLMEGRGVRRDVARAAAIYQRSCDAQLGFACVELGSRLADGIDLTRDEPRAVELFRQGCRHAHPPACTWLATMLAAGRGTLTDERGAATLLHDACGHRDAAACTRLGVFTRTGRGGVAADPRNALALWQRGCELGDGEGCAEAARVHREGIGVTADETRAATLLARACALGHAASCQPATP